MHGRLGLLIGRMHSQALPKRVAELDGPMLLSQQIAEGFICEVLQPLPFLQAQVLKRMPDLIIEFYAAANGHEDLGNRSQAKPLEVQGGLSLPSKRELIEPHKGDKRYIRRDSKGRIKESDDIGRSLPAD